MELKLPGSEGQPDAVVNFLLLAFGKKFPKFTIERSVAVVLSPFIKSLETTTGVLFQFLFVLFWRDSFGEHCYLMMGQGPGQLGQAAMQFLNVVGGERCFATDPFAMSLVELNGSPIALRFVFEYRQGLKSRPLTGQDQIHLGLLHRGESSEVGRGFFVVGHVRSSTLERFYPPTPTPFKRISCKECGGFRAGSFKQMLCPGICTSLSIRCKRAALQDCPKAWRSLRHNTRSFYKHLAAERQ